MTPRDDPHKPSPNDLVDYIEESNVTYKHVCWDCGWSEEVTVTVTRE